MIKIIVIGLLLVVIVVVFFLKATKRRVAHYDKKPLLTGNETEFFGRLCRAVPELHVFPQLAMSAIIKPRDSYQQNKPAYWAINKKIIDFSIYTKSMELVCIVELDDKMHNPERDAARDRCTASAGIQTLRFQSKKKPCEAEICAAIDYIRATNEKAA